jgi:hypothetical protein
LKFEGKIRNPRRDLASALNSIGMIDENLVIFFLNPGESYESD